MAISTRARRIFSRARFAFFVATWICLSGCVRHEPPADLTILNGAEPQSLDPGILSGQADMRVALGMFEGLTYFDPKTGSAIPGLAERWEISPDGRTYTFHLRTNLVWSTGEPITAEDVVYSWIRALSPVTASEYAGSLFFLKHGQDFTDGKIKDPAQVGVHALDPLTVRVELNHPTPFFPDICAMPVACVVPRQTIEKFGDRWLMAKPLPVSGAYEMAYWRLNDKVRLRKNPRYWNAANTRSDLIDILPVGSANAALSLYERGEADIVWDAALIPAGLLDVLLKRPDFHTFICLDTYFFRFNVTRKPFDDPRVRQALALAVDKERIVRKITQGGEQPASHLVPDGTANYTPPEGLGYDPARARRLLAEAGYPGGQGFPRFQYLFNASAGGGSKIHEKIAVELQQMWRDELGIQMDLRQMEWSAYLNAQSQLDFDLSRSSWVADYNDANTFLGLFTSHDGNNRTGWKNARYDDLIQRANQEPDLQAREKLFQEAETMLVRDEVPIVPIYFYVGISYYDTNQIQGIYPNVLDNHPLQAIRKVGRGSSVEGRGPDPK
jgi:oligopeptide transport system substrate-binding protein